jgi:hypothetical protein
VQKDAFYMLGVVAFLAVFPANQEVETGGSQVLGQPKGKTKIIIKELDACLAYIKPWAQSPGLQNNKKQRCFLHLSIHSSIHSISKQFMENLPWCLVVS